MVFRGPGVGAACRQPLLSASQEVFSRGLARPSCHPFWLVQEPEHHPWPPASLRLGSQCSLGDLQTHCWGWWTGKGRVEASGESLGPPSWDTDPAVQQLWLMGNRPSWPSAEGGQGVRRVSCWSVFSLPLSLLKTGNTEPIHPLEDQAQGARSLAQMYGLVENQVEVKGQPGLGAGMAMVLTFTGAGLCTCSPSSMRRNQSVSASLLERHDRVAARGLQSRAVGEAGEAQGGHMTCQRPCSDWSGEPR